jgi:diguanylate cyclase (GGDEF)-like protein
MPSRCGNPGLRARVVPDVFHRFSANDVGVSYRRLFVVSAAACGALIAVLIVASLLGLGGAELEDTIHNLAEVAAGLIAAALALLAASRSRGRRRIAWFCWSAYALLAAVGEGIADWNALVTHGVLTFPSAADIAFLLQVPAGVAGAVILLRVNSSRLAVGVAVLDGLIVGVGVLVIGLATILEPIITSGNSLAVIVVSLAEPVTDVIVLTLVITVVVRVASIARVSPLLIAVGVLGVALADSAATYQIAIGDSTPGSTFAIGWTAGLLGVGLGALHWFCFRSRADVRVRSAPTSAWGIVVPILPVALSSVFAIVKYFGDGETLDLVIWAIALVSLTLARMCLALFLNARLGQSLAHQAMHDSLTALPNRTMLLRSLQRRLAAVQDAGAQVLVLMFDIDGFKGVNDTYGHPVGDQLLVQVAERVVATTREDDLTARLGGDEFAILVANGSREQAMIVTLRILAALEIPFTLGNTKVSIGASVGIAIAEPGESADELLRNADLAMYAAKASGGGCYSVYEPQMHLAVVERTRLEYALGMAWHTDELLVHYQPIVDIASGRLVSVEALARWRNPDGEVIPPAVFIPVAEQTGAIVQIGIRVLNDACHCLARWQLQFPEAGYLSVSVNLSPRQLRSHDLVDTVGEALRASGIKPECLILEVTETALMEDLESAIRVLGRLKSLGIRLAIDDFGVGASSLARLRRLPVDIVKIDKSLVDHVPDGHVASGLLDAVVGVVRALQLRIVIEGVERVDQAAHLRASGYDLAQGYYFARPMDADAIGTLLASAQSGHVVLGDAAPAVGGRATALDAASDRVLVVDDDIDLGTVACRVLESQGMRATLALTFKQAETEILRGVDVMVIDIGLPDGDGWDLIRTVRASAEHARVPVVIMTGLLDSADVLNRAYNLQCEYLGKPFAREALVAKVRLARKLVAADALSSAAAL